MTKYHTTVKTRPRRSLREFPRIYLPVVTTHFHAGVEKEATIVNTFESSVSYNMKADRLLDGKGLDGVFSSG